MTNSQLDRLAGPVALGAGVLLTIQQLAMLPLVDRSRGLVAMVGNSLFQAAAIAYFLAFCALLIALVAVYARIARAAGALGVIGFGAAMVGTTFMAGDLWYEAFAVPWLLSVAPVVLGQGPSGQIVTYAVTTFALFAIGWVLFGIASLRARVFPTAISLAIVVGGVVGFQAAQPPFAIPLGLALAWLGGWLMRTAEEGGSAGEPAGA